MTTTDRPDDLLAIYLNDHLAVGIGWRELANRAARENEGTPLGEALAEVARQIAEDASTLEGIMEHLEISRSPVKGPLAVAGERLARLKLNGRLSGYSPLSRFEELDALTVGIRGKRQFWEVLKETARLGERVPDVDFDDLMRRADAQRETLAPFLHETGIEAFATRP